MEPQQKRKYLTWALAITLMGTAGFGALAFQYEQLPRSEGGAGPLFWVAMAFMVLWAAVRILLLFNRPMN